MKLTPRAESLQGQAMDGAHFTGPASSHVLLVNEEPNRVAVSVVRFEPGTRNHWHSHSGGQMLHVVEGSGYVQARGAPLQPITEGDSISAAPGEQHWHGAGRSGPMAHVTVTIGQVEWLEESPPPD